MGARAEAAAVAAGRHAVAEAVASVREAQAGGALGRRPVLPSRRNAPCPGPQTAMLSELEQAGAVPSAPV